MENPCIGVSMERKESLEGGYRSILKSARGNTEVSDAFSFLSKVGSQNQRVSGSFRNNLVQPNHYIYFTK